MEGLRGRIESQIAELKNRVDIPHLSPKALATIGLGALAINTACTKADLGPVGGIAAICGFAVLPVAVLIYLRLKS